MVIAEIIGPDLLIVGAVILVLLFGGAKLPELARSLGSAKSEFEKASKETHAKKAAEARRAEADVAETIGAVPASAPVAVTPTGDGEAPTVEGANGGPDFS